MLRTKGEAGTGNVVEAVRHARTVQRELRMVAAMDEDELFVFAKQIQVRSTPFCYTLQIEYNTGMYIHVHVYDGYTHVCRCEMYPMLWRRCAAPTLRSGTC
jgi:pyridoxal biosynthesis lyase PdxS